MRQGIAWAALAALSATAAVAQEGGAPAGAAQDLVCTMAALCEDGDCRALGVAMSAGVEGATAWLGPSGDDRLVLDEVPVDFPSQRLFATADGPDGDAVVLALHDDGRLVMFQSPARPDIRFAAIIGQCREAG